MEDRGQAGQQDEQRQRERKHIFCVNGESAFLEVLRALFQDEHFNVTTTNFVPHSWDMVAALRPDLVILDLVVGRRAGWELLERLESEAATRRIPVLAVSTSPELLARAREQQSRYGAERYLPKPLDIEDLLRTVHEMIGPA